MSAVSEEDYGALDISDVTSDEINADILRCLKRNDPNKSFVALGQLDEDYRAYHEYIPEDARSMLAFGYYVGRCTNITQLTVQLRTELDRSVIEPFILGLRSNRSIEMLRITSHIPREFFRMLTPFMSSNPNLEMFEVDGCEMDVEQFRSLSAALREGSSPLKNLMIVGRADGDYYHEDHLIDIIEALKMHPQLEEISFSRFDMGRNACESLSNLLRQSVAGMERLALCNNDIDDSGVEALVEGLAHCRGLQGFQLARNPAITVRGYRALASLLEDPNSSLQFLNLGMNEINDEIGTIIANALAHNSRLENLHLDFGASMMSIGWQAFSKVLCDTTSANRTFLSNHTLRNLSLGDEHDALPDDIESLLALNEHYDKKRVAIRKILRHHDDFDMQPLFEWDLKVLPFVVGWFERPATCAIETGAGNQKRKLSAIHQFIRGMPELAIEAISGVTKKSAKGVGEKRPHSTAFEGR